MTDQQANALQNLYEALAIATNCGLLDVMAAEIHPDTINTFCDATEAMVKSLGTSPQN